MSRQRLSPVAALAATLAMIMQAHAGQPVVISGLGPENFPDAPPPVAAPARSGGYGGGFIELLVTGSAGAPAPAPMRVAPAQAWAAPATPVNVAPYESSPMVERAIVGPASMVPPEFQRQEVSYDGAEPVGTIIVDTPSRHLYYVLGHGRALRYGIGVGRPGFEWAGVKTISRKAEWPDWTPPSEMILRRPDLPRHMAGGPDNPLGARALYLGSSLYRIHGTNEPNTIGKNVSSGCIRMMNEDVTDLYERAHVGGRVIVI